MGQDRLDGGYLTWSEHVAAVQDGGEGFKVVEVVWEDASAYAINWEAEHDCAVRITTTVGYLVDYTEDAISIVSMINTHQVGHGVVIPNSAILSWRDLT